MGPIYRNAWYRWCGRARLFFLFSRSRVAPCGIRNDRPSLPPVHPCICTPLDRTLSGDLLQRVLVDHPVLHDHPNRLDAVPGRCILPVVPRGPFRGAPRPGYRPSISTTEGMRRLYTHFEAEAAKAGRCSRKRRRCAEQLVAASRSDRAPQEAPPKFWRNPSS